MCQMSDAEELIPRYVGSVKIIYYYGNIIYNNKMSKLGNSDESGPSPILNNKMTMWGLIQTYDLLHTIDRKLMIAQLIAGSFVI